MKRRNGWWIWSLVLALLLNVQGSAGSGATGVQAAGGTSGSAGTQEADGTPETADAQTADVSTETAVTEESGSAQAANTRAAGGGESAPAAAETEVQLSEPMKGAPVAENDRFVLYLDESTLNVRVADKKTGAEWSGYPQTDRKMPPNNVKFVQSPIHIKYTQGTETSQTYSLQHKDNTAEWTRLDNGVRMRFTFAELQISLDVVYELTDDGLTVTIPFDSVTEQGASRLVSVEPLPFFMAAHPWQEGAIFVPDGSGALMTIKRERAQNFNTYSEYVYGSDPVFLKESHVALYPLWRLAQQPMEIAALPVYGLYADGRGFLGIVTQGDFDAKINAVPAGIRNIALYRTSAEFIYRHDDIVFIGNSGEIPLYQGQMVAGDRQVKFVLLQGDEAHYVGMAGAYRRYLQETGKLEKLTERQAPLHLRVFGGVLRYEIIGKTFIRMTTFEQVREIMEAYRSRGVEQLIVTLEGWSKQGVYGKQPQHFPVESALGGYKDLEELAEYARAQGIRLYLQANYVRPFDKTGRFRRNRDAVYGILKEPQPDYQYYLSERFNKMEERFYWLKPERVFASWIEPEMKDYRRLGVAGVHLEWMGTTVYSDQDPRRRTDRRQTGEVWVRTLERVREQVGEAAVDYGNGYVLGYVDRIDRLPLDSSRFTYLDETVPFYPIVVHGYIPYTAAPSNLEDDPRAAFLRKLEYGAMPSYRLTYEPVSRLQRTMMHELFSSEFAQWMEPSLEEYEVLKTLHHLTFDQEITGHESLSPWVYRTTYANGVQVLVNYGDREQTVDGHTLEAYGYRILQAEGA
jgi:hypothetical protein